MSHLPFIRRIRPYIQHRRPDVAAKAKYFPNSYPTTPVEKLMPALDKDVHVPRRPHMIQSNYELGQDARLRLIGERVTKLIKYERIELMKVQAWETRMYAEQLIIQALRYGDRHRYTMECADFWLHEKGLVHKLFKVLVPRYANYTTAFTSFFLLAPRYDLAATPLVSWQERVAHRSDPYPADISRLVWNERACLELKGNPLPPLRVPPPKNANILTNVLMAAAREDAYRRKNEQHGQEEGGAGGHTGDPIAGALSDSKVDSGKPADSNTAL